MVFVVFVVLVCQILCKPALQATLRVFGLCGSCVVLVWVVLWFLVTCGFWLWSARPIVLMWFLALVLLSMPMIARPLVDGLCGSVALWIFGLARIDARPLALFGL